jgi:small subunit ribosomal protein S16
VAVRIRLRRIGKKKQPQYRMVVAEALGPRDGKFIEIIGNYDPRRVPPLYSVNEERALNWLRNGAQPSETAQRVLAHVGIWEKFAAEKGKKLPAPPAQAENA